MSPHGAGFALKTQSKLRTARHGNHVTALMEGMGELTDVVHV